MYLSEEPSDTTNTNLLYHSVIQQIQFWFQDNIPVAIMKQVRARYVDNPDFDPEKIKSASKACEGLSRWVLAIEKYDVYVTKYKFSGKLNRIKYISAIAVV